MKKGVKIAIGAAVVVVAAAGIFSILGRKPEVVDDDVRPAVVAEKPQTGTISLYTDVIGTIEPSETVSVTPKIDGEILEVMFEAGQYVEAGQPLCRIDSDALTALRISMESAQVAMNDANSTLQRTRPCSRVVQFPSRLLNRLRTRLLLQGFSTRPLRTSMTCR